MRRFVPALVLTLLTAGCTLNTDYFSEYRGRNLLGNYGFETGKWTNQATTDFLTWEAASTDTAINAIDGALPTPGQYIYGPDGASPAYHLEIKNLISNGDFEGTAPGALSGAYWTIDSPTAATAATVVGSGTFSAFSASQKLEWVADLGARLVLNITSAVPAAGWVDTRYRLRADYMIDATSTNHSVDFYLTDGSTTTPVTAWPFSNLNPGGINVLNDTFTVSGHATTTRRFWIGSPSSSNTNHLEIDNIRLVPDDGTLYARATLQSLSSGVLKLLPGSKVGMYTLTLYVRDDPSTLAAGGTVKNRFQAQNLTVKVTAGVKSGSREPDPTIFPRTASWATGWTKLTMNFGFDFYDSDVDLGSTAALTVALSPTINQTGSVDVGSLLVAQPSLTFNP